MLQNQTILWHLHHRRAWDLFLPIIEGAETSVSAAGAQAPRVTLPAPLQPPSKHFNDAVRNFAVNGTANRAGLSGPQIAVAAAAAARAAAAAALQPDLPEGCARARPFHPSQVCPRPFPASWLLMSFIC